MIFIGTTCRNEWSSSTCRWCITVFITSSSVLDGLLHYKSVMWPVDDIFVLLVLVLGVLYSIWLYIDRVSARMGVSPIAWNSISDDLRDSTLIADSFKRLLGCFQSTSTYSALEVSHFIMRYINLRIIYLLARSNSSKKLRFRFWIAEVQM